MDIQAILDASDSSDDGVDLPSYRLSEEDSPHHKDLLVEQILREVEDDEDEEEEDNDEYNYNNNIIQEGRDVADDLSGIDDEEDYDSGFDLGPPSHRHSRHHDTNNNPHQHPRSTATTTTTLWEGSLNSITYSRYDYNSSTLQRHSYTSQAHNPEDWAVLQAILQEDEDDEDNEPDDEDLVWPTAATTMPLVPSGDRHRHHHHRRPYDDPISVDEILQDDDDEEEDDVNGDAALFVEDGDLEDSLLDVSALSMTPSALTPPDAASPIRASANRNVSYQPSAAKTSMVNGSPSPVTYQTSSSRPAWSNAPKLESKDVHLHPRRVATMPLTVDQVDEETSRNAMAQARAYERKLLKSGHREIFSPLLVKRRLKPKIELGPRGRVPKKQSAAERLTASSTPRFGFSGIVENKPTADTSRSLHNHVKKDAKVQCGLPTCLAFNSKFLAVGTQLGYILMYDLFEVLRQRLSTSQLDDAAARRAGSITSLDLSHNGEALIAGYESGLLLLWDTIRGIVLRSVSDVHPSPITSVRFLQELKVVTVDSGGLVNKLTFARNLIWSNYNMETDCLLDGTAGQILAMNVLPPFSSVNPLVRPDSLAPFLRNLTLIALSSERSSFAVAVDPSVHVLHRWSRPPPEKVDAEATELLPPGQTYLPCLAWGWALTSGGRNVVMPILARSWGCCLQLLCASFPTLDDDDNTKAPDNGKAQVHWPAFGIHEEIDTSTPVVALEWLNDRSLVYLTVTNEFTVVDSVMLTMVERLDFSSLKLVYAEFSLSRCSEGGPQIPCTTFQNSIRCSDDRLMVLCREELRCISIVTARRRITSLEEDGEWLEALALALDHYENTVVSQEDKKRIKDFSRHPEFSGAKSEEEEWIAKLLTRYINLAIDNAPESAREYELSPGGTHSKIDLAQSHFQMLAGVCVEFCVITRRLDLLFGPIFRRFEAVGYSSVFLDVLQPYVLSEKLNYIAPEVMAYFIEHCKSSNGIATVERCLLHMDVRIMDFDNILMLLRENEMFSALFYVFNKGLDDYVTPLDLIMDRLFDEADSGSASKPRCRDGTLQTTFERLGYKAILYLQNCFQGKTFPQEEDLVPEDRKHSLKRELVIFLIREDFQCNAHSKRKVEKALVGQRALLYPYMRLLLLVDPKEMLDTISLAVDSTPNEALRERLPSEDWVVDGNPSSSVEMPDIQEIMGVLESIVLPSPGGLEALAIELPSLVGAFLDFTAKYLMASSAVSVNREVIFMIIRRLSDQFTGATDFSGQEQAQRRVMELLSALPRDSYEPDKALSLISHAGIHRAALLLHQQVASSWHEDRSKDIELRSDHFRSAIDCYVEDRDESFRREVFDYIKKECSGVSDLSDTSENAKPTSLRDALFSKLPSLVNLDPLLTACLVSELFVDELDRVVEALEADRSGVSLFQFFQAIVSGHLVEVDPVAGSVVNLTMEHHHKYLSLMAKLHPEMVYDYLSTHDNYRAEECLKLCQQYDIADASAYLLERLGNVSSALQLILQTLESRLMNLKRTIRVMGTEVFRLHSSRLSLRTHSHTGSGFLHTLSCSPQSARDADRTKRILTVALDLCIRNSGTLSKRSEHGSQLFFNVLDRLINAKGFLRLSKEQPIHAKVMAGVLSELLQLTMQRMVSSVPLTDLVRKVTSDHSGSRLGELREMIESLLGTYGFELKVFESAITVFHHDVSIMKREHRTLRLEGHPVQSVMTVPLKPSKAETSTASHAADQYMVKPAADVTLCAGSNGNASVVGSDAAAALFNRQASDGLVASLSKLRSRRNTNGGPGTTYSATSRSTLRRGAAVAPSMWTVTDRLYQAGEMEPILFGARPVGALGNAQHRGRLMTFQ